MIVVNKLYQISNFCLLKFGYFNFFKAVRRQSIRNVVAQFLNEWPVLISRWLFWFLRSHWLAEKESNDCPNFDQFSWFSQSQLPNSIHPKNLIIKGACLRGEVIMYLFSYVHVHHFFCIEQKWFFIKPIKLQMGGKLLKWMSEFKFWIDFDSMNSIVILSKFWVFVLTNFSKSSVEISSFKNVHFRIRISLEFTKKSKCKKAHHSSSLQIIGRLHCLSLVNPEWILRHRNKTFFSDAILLCAIVY